jgi:RNA polymerase sigma-70 factor (ECF subfamily)
MDEREVIQRVLEGDAESFRLLVERYAGAVARMIRNVVGDSHTCEDLAQEVFLTAYAKLGTFDPARSRFSTWLSTIARNKAVNAAVRKKPRYMAHPPEQADASDPEVTAERKELLGALDRAVLALPLNQRTAFVLAEFEQLPYEQIAQIEGVRLGTSNREQRARVRLMELSDNSRETPHESTGNLRDLEGTKIAGRRGVGVYRSGHARHPASRSDTSHRRHAVATIRGGAALGQGSSADHGNTPGTRPNHRHCPLDPVRLTEKGTRL